MPFGQLVVGSPGAGKTTYCHGLHQFLSALGRPISIVNLDPANAKSLPYPCAISIGSLITVNDVMSELGLGPNGAMLYCMEYLEQNFDWLERELDQLGDDTYVAFDLPGQVEISTNHPSLRRILERLQKRDWRLVAVHLLDASHITDASRYISMVLLSLRAMLTLELPHVNVLSKVDLLGDAASGSRRRQSVDEEMDNKDEDEEEDDSMSEDSARRRGGLAFNLDYYTEVQDLSYLQEQLSESMGPRRSKRFADLNERICELIEEFGLVQFETLAVEDKRSMLRLQRVLDKATGYVYVERSANTRISSTAAEQQASRRGTAATASALFSVADQGAPLGWGTALDVQERWVDHRKDWEPIEIKERMELEQRWKREQEREQNANTNGSKMEQN